MLGTLGGGATNFPVVRRRQEPSSGFELESSPCMEHRVFLLALKYGIGAFISASWNALEGGECSSLDLFQMVSHRRVSLVLLQIALHLKKTATSFKE